MHCQAQVCILEFLGLETGMHPHQLTMEEQIAQLSCKYCANIDMDVLARKQLLKTATSGNLPKIEDESGFQPVAPEELQHLTESVGGNIDGIVEDDVETEDDDLNFAPTAAVTFSLHEVKTILCRSHEIALANRPGPTPERYAQMIAFAKLFRPEEQKGPEIVNENMPEETQSYGNKTGTVLLHQDAVIKLMLETSVAELDKNIESAENDIEVMKLTQAKKKLGTCHRKLFLGRLSCTLAQGPKKFAWALCQKATLTDEQINAVALVVLPLQDAFEKRTNKESHLIDCVWQDGLVRTIYVGSGGCGKSLLINQVFTPLFLAYFGPQGLVKQAPSNKAARLISGRTLHVATALRARDSLKTATLKPNDVAFKKLQILNIPAGAQVFDEFSQIPAPLLHAVSLRSMYARRGAYGLDLNTYTQFSGLFGKVPVLQFFGDHLQLPPVPQSMSLFASTENASSEQRAGCAIFSNIQDVYVFHTARRFTDPVLISILEGMRTPGGKRLNETAWEKLKGTEVDTQSPNFSPDNFIAETHNWFHVAYTWSLVTMAVFVRAKAEAKRDCRTLFYLPALDKPTKYCTPALYKGMVQTFHLHGTQKLPSICLLYIGMRVRLTTSVQPPFAVQDCLGTIVALDLHAHDVQQLAQHKTEHVLRYLPQCVYVKLDGCDHVFLPPKSCSKHGSTGYSPQCSNCSRMVGVFAIKPLKRKWHFKSNMMDFKCTVERTAFPLMPASTCALHAMHKGQLPIQASSCIGNFQKESQVMSSG